MIFDKEKIKLDSRKIPIKMNTNIKSGIAYETKNKSIIQFKRFVISLNKKNNNKMK